MIIIVMAVIIIVLFVKMVRIVPEQEAWIIEEFGKYKKTLEAGLHLVIPVVHKIAYRHHLKEEVIDVRPQVCITNDNVQVTVDGILYLRVIDPVKASYGIENYRYATAQLAQTTMRSEIGKIELDNTFSEREAINNSIVKSVDEASDPWGIKVTRYEIKDLDPPETVIQAMEQQMRAEREKRADILESDGYKLAEINESLGIKEESINISKGQRATKINEAEGKAKAIEITSGATAESIKIMGEAIHGPGGKSAMTLRLAQQYIDQLGNILGKVETEVLPLQVSGARSVLETIIPALKGDK